MESEKTNKQTRGDNVKEESRESEVGVVATIFVTFMCQGKPDSW